MLEKPATGVEREHEQSIVMMDGNEAVAAVAHLLNEVIAIYGMIEEWCFAPELTDFSSVFQDLSTFNEDISAWVRTRPEL